VLYHSSHGNKQRGHGSSKFLEASGLFIAQPPAFFTLLQDLASEADAARHGD
jgi:hypothetical protein